MPYRDERPTERTIGAARHKDKSQVLLIQKWEKRNKDIFAILIVDESNFDNILASISPFGKESEARKKAQEWMNRNEHGI